MEILLGIVTSILLEVYKKLSDKFGKTATNRVIYLGLFVLSLGWVILQKYTNFLTIDTLKSYWLLVVSAVGVYEIIIKNLNKYILGKK